VTHRPALIRLPTKICGFSTNESILPDSSYLTTPYFEGSDTYTPEHTHARMHSEMSGT
jgi:hypothetical protein